MIAKVGDFNGGRGCVSESGGGSGGGNGGSGG